MSNNLSEIHTQVIKTLQVAIGLKDEKTIRAFIGFFREVIAETIEHKKIIDFEQYINFPYLIYNQVAKQRGVDQLHNMVELCDILPLHLREMIVLITWNASAAGSKVDRKTVNAFYELGFRSFNNLFFLQTAMHDWKLLEAAINKFSQLESEFSSTGILKANLKALQFEGEDNGDQIEKLRTEIYERQKFKSYKRHVVIVLKYWIYELFGQHKIPKNDAIKILNTLDRCRMEYKDAQDVLYLRRKNLRDYMGWDAWDHSERPEGIQYETINATDWITRGFILDRIRLGNQTFIVDNALLDADEVRWFYDEIEKNISLLSNNANLYQAVMGNGQFDDVVEFTNKLVNAIGISKRAKLSAKDIQIKDAPLDQSKISQFVKLLGEKWSAQLRIRRLFNRFGNSTDISGQARKLMRIGPQLFLDKGKIMFLQGDLYTRIYGAEDIGAQVARREDDLFFERVLNSEAEKIYCPTMVELLLKSIKKLRDRAVTPDVVFISPEYLYQDPEFLKSDFYTQTYQTELNSDDINFLIIGRFDGIPLYTSYSQALTNRVVVCEFGSAFDMRYKTREDWFKKILSVEVREVTNELAEDKFNQGLDKWKFTDNGDPLSKEDALTLIKTSVILDIETLLDFDVKEITKVIVGEIGR